MPVILEQEVTFPDYIDLKDESKDFILSCLAKLTTLRPDIASLADHPFFRIKKAGSSLHIYDDIQLAL